MASKALSELELCMPVLYEYTQLLWMHYSRFHPAAVRGFAEAALEMNRLLHRAADRSQPFEETFGMRARCLAIGSAMRAALTDIRAEVQRRGAPKDLIADIHLVYSEVVVLCRGCLSNVDRDIRVRQEAARGGILGGLQKTE